MNRADFPPDWNHHSVLAQQLMAVLEGADCGWIQSCCALGFAVCTFVGTYDDREQREAMAGTIIAGLIRAAESGAMPGERLQ
jgi:hypothetical protein